MTEAGPTLKLPMLGGAPHTPPTSTWPDGQLALTVVPVEAAGPIPETASEQVVLPTAVTGHVRLPLPPATEKLAGLAPVHTSADESAPVPVADQVAV